jgi:hypothetical protein
MGDHGSRGDVQAKPCAALLIAGALPESAEDRLPLFLLHSRSVIDYFY